MIYYNDFTAVKLKKIGCFRLMQIGFKFFELSDS